MELRSAVRISYEVEYKSPSTNNAWVKDPEYTNKAATSYTVTKLGANVTYYFHVRAVEALGNTSEWSETLTYTNPVSAPLSAPTSLSATKASSSTAKISWNAVSGATYYQVQYNSPTSGGWVTDPDYSSRTSYISTRLGNNTYQFRVRAANASGTSDWATISYVHTTS